MATIGSRKVETQECAIVFDPEMARSIIGMLFSVANGSSFWRKSSYLIGREGEPIASPLVTVIDDPLIPRAPGSRPFDGDGLATRKQPGRRARRARARCCATSTARRKLGRQSTGSAGRRIGGNPGPTTSNLIMQPGAMTRRGVAYAIPRRGSTSPHLMGFGFNAGHR